MTKIMWKIVALVLVIIQKVQSQNCESDWTNLQSCMKSRYNEYSAQKRLSDNDRQGLENKIRDCYTQQECQDPFPPANQSSAMKTCYIETQKIVRHDIEMCVQKDFSDFDLPEDDSLVYLWMQDEIYIKAAEDNSKICGPYANTNNLNTCVTAALTDAFTNPNKNREMCDVRKDCTKQTSDVCLSKWQDKIKPKLCQCASDQRKLNGYKTQYKQCLQRNAAVQLDLDAYPKFLDNLKSLSCSKNSDPCGGTSGGTGKNKTVVTTTTQNPLGSLLGLGGTSGGTGSGTGGANNIPNALSNLAKLITGSGGSLIGNQARGGSSLTSALKGGSGSGSGLGALTGGGTSGGDNVVNNIVNVLTSGSNALVNLFNGQGTSTNVLTQGNPLTSLKQVISDTPGFGSLKGNGGYGSLLGGRGLNYDVLG